MTGTIVLAIAIVAAAVLLFGFSIGVGLVLGRRIDRRIEARFDGRASEDARSAATGPGEQAAAATDETRRETSDG